MQAGQVTARYSKEVTIMKDIFTAPFVEEMRKNTANMYRLGWDERNGGNISYLLDTEEVREYLDLNKVIRTIPLGFDATDIIGKIFIVTGTGKYFKNVDIRPRFGVWENVPGAFSSGSPKGEDFRIVLEEFLRINFDSVYVPRPYTGRWESAGRILLGDTFSLAWRVFDTQYWPGTPQRRRRIYLVVDFGGETAPKILFDQESLCWDYSAGIRTGETPAGAAADCP